MLTVLWAPTGSSESTVEEFALPPNARGPISVEPDAEGRLWVTLHEAWGVARYDPRTNETVVLNLSVPKDEIYSLVGLEIAPDGKVWMLSVQYIHQVDPERMEVESFEMPVRNTLLAGALHLRPEGVLWASLSDRDVIVSFDMSSHQMRTYDAPGKFQGPLEFADVGDDMLVTLTYQGTYARFDPETGEFEKQPQDLFIGPQAILWDDGHVWVAEHGGTSVAKHVPGEASVERFPTTRPKASGLSGPSDLLRSDDGAIWFVEHLGDRIGRLDPANDTLVEFDLISGPYTNTQQFTQAPDGAIWAAVEANDTLARIEYGGEQPTFTLPKNITVKAGQTVRVPVNLSGEAALGATDLGLVLSYENGSVVIAPKPDLDPGAYRMVVSEKNGPISVGRFVDVHVEGEKATPLPSLLPVAAVGLVVLVKMLSAQDSGRRSVRSVRRRLLC